MSRGRLVGLGIAALAVLGAAALSLSWFLQYRANAALQAIQPAFTGSGSCQACHARVFDQWKGSHHERAMDVAHAGSVLGDFDDARITVHGVTSRFYRRDGRYFVYTTGADDTPREFEITHTFGVAPLQQYLVPFPGGRLQCLPLAWDTERKRWFSLTPDAPVASDDWLHWTQGAQNWNGMCAQCHSTNLRKRYDPTSNTFSTTWSEISVGCEACHGPGARHIAWARLPASTRARIGDRGLVQQTSGLTSTQRVEACASCHARRAELSDDTHQHAALMDHVVPSVLDEALYYADGQQQDEVYVYGSFLQSRMYAKGVACTHCHDPHTARLLRPGNETCLACHQRQVFDVTTHHFHQAQHDGRPSPAVLCTACHMPTRTYMGVDDRADHAIRVPRPDLTETYGVPNACNQAGCHADKPAAWSSAAIARWYQKPRPPHYADIFAPARRGAPEAERGLIALASNREQAAIVRATAVALLARYVSADAEGTLQRALTDPHPLIRHSAALAWRDRAAAERAVRVAPLLSDPITAVRLAAAFALADIDAAQLTPDVAQRRARALREYDAAMQHSLDLPSGGMNLGVLADVRNRPEEAERYYRMALRVDRRFYPAAMNLAILLSRQGRGRDAESVLRQTVEVVPDRPELASALGLLLAERGSSEEALPWLQRAADALPADARAARNLGVLLQQLGRQADATWWLDEARRRESSTVAPDRRPR